MSSIQEYIEGYRDFNTKLGADTIEDYLVAFNAYFPDNEFQTDPKKKLDPQAIQTEKKISCTAAAMLIALFISDKFPNAVLTFFRDSDAHYHVTLQVDFTNQVRYFSWLKTSKLHEVRDFQIPLKVITNNSLNEFLTQKAVAYAVKFDQEPSVQ